MRSIEINIDNPLNNINILIDMKTNKMIFNNQTLPISEDKIKELLRIIRTWSNTYGKSSKNIDSEKFLIKIIEKNNIDIIKGDGTYPSNYYELKQWIGDLND